MLWLYILGGILLFIGIILAVVFFGRIRIAVTFCDDFLIVARLAGVPVKYYPDKPEKPAKRKKTRLRDYTPAAMKRRAEKKAKKDAKKAAVLKKEAEAAEKKKAAGEEIGLVETLRLLLEFLKVLFTKYGKKLRVKAAKLHVTVGTDDAAKTALIYGGVSQAICYIVAFLDDNGLLTGPEKADVKIVPDWLSGRTAADIDIEISLTIAELIGLILNFGIGSTLDLMESETLNSKKKD